MRCAVVGGSIGGLCTGVALRARGWEPRIFERDTGPGRPAGAGIVVQPDLLRVMRDGGCPPLPTTSCRVRRFLERVGGRGRDQRMPQSFMSWSSIHDTLRAGLPEGAIAYGTPIGVGDEAAPYADASLDGADLVVWADGQGSAARRRLLPEVSPQYAGYVAWRGTVDEAVAGPGLSAFFDDAFTFCDDPRGGHALVYLIPGEGNDVRPGSRRLNWVWYVGADDRELSTLLVDGRGRRRSSSLPAGSVPPAIVDDVRAQAMEFLHPMMADLVAATAEPFLQAIMDVTVPRTVFGRSCLLGDAGFVVRPHTAGATAKAAWEAGRLASELALSPADVPAALRRFERAQLEYGRGLLAHGQALGARWARRRSVPA